MWSLAVASCEFVFFITIIICIVSRLFLFWISSSYVHYRSALSIVNSSWFNLAFPLTLENYNNSTDVEWDSAVLHSSKATDLSILLGIWDLCTSRCYIPVPRRIIMRMNDCICLFCGNEEQLSYFYLMGMIMFCWV